MKNSDKCVARLLKLFCLAIGSLPRKRHASLADVLGRIWFVLDKRHRVVTIDNLKQAYPDLSDDRKIRILARRIFANFSRVFLEVCWAMKSDLHLIGDQIDHDDIRFIKEALKANRGVLILTGHLGNWELLPLVPSLEKIINHAVYRPLDFKPMDHLVMSMRSRFGTRLIPSTNALRRIIGALRKNEIVGLLIDQNANCRKGVVIDFFGRPAYGNKGLALIARHTGAPVVPAFLVRENDRFKFVSGPAIPFIHTGDTRKDIEINTQRYHQAIEQVVRKYPDQWFWVHRRWKSKLSCPWPRPSS